MDTVHGGRGGHLEAAPKRTEDGTVSGRGSLSRAFNYSFVLLWQQEEEGAAVQQSEETDETSGAWLSEGPHSQTAGEELQVMMSCKSGISFALPCRSIGSWECRNCWGSRQ